MTLAAQQSYHMTVSQLLTNHVRDASILQAMNDVPRNLFVPDALQASAYVDEDINVGNGRYLMAPLTFARLLDIANITPNCRVLNIGALHGYTAAILGLLSNHVVATECGKAQVMQTGQQLAALNITHVRLEPVQSLAEGYAKAGPYDVILIAGGIEAIPNALKTQLSETGRIVTVTLASERPDIRGGMGKGCVIHRANDHYHMHNYFDAAAVVLPGFEEQKNFSF